MRTIARRLPIATAVLMALVGAGFMRPRPAAAQEVVRVTPVPSARDPDPWFGRDKALHFGASAALALGGYGATALGTDDVGHRLGVAAAVALGAGITKEIVDHATGGDPSLRDLTWDVLGTASGLLVAWLLDRFVF